MRRTEVDVKSPIKMKLPVVERGEMAMVMDSSSSGGWGKQPAMQVTVSRADAGPRGRSRHHHPHRFVQPPRC